MSTTYNSVTKYLTSLLKDHKVLIEINDNNELIYFCIFDKITNIQIENPSIEINIMGNVLSLFDYEHLPYEHYLLELSFEIFRDVCELFSLPYTIETKNIIQNSLLNLMTNLKDRPDIKITIPNKKIIFSTPTIIETVLQE